MGKRKQGALLGRRGLLSRERKGGSWALRGIPGAAHPGLWSLVPCRD